MNKLISIHEAVNLVKSKNTVAIGGFVGIGHPEEISVELEKNFLINGTPNNLTLMYAAGQGDGKKRGINHFAHEGFVKRLIFGHVGLAPLMAKLITDNLVEAYNFPQGVVSQLFRDIASGKPGTITKTGLNTFVDPRISGGKLNEKTKDNLVEIINITGEEYLLFKKLPIDIALIKGTFADEIGNISLEKEAGFIDSLAIAQAAHNSGGKVVAQVDEVVKTGSLNPWLVKIPGMLVDAFFIVNKKYKYQTFVEKYNPTLSGEIKIPNYFIKNMKFGVNKIICRRALSEIKNKSLIIA